MSKEIKWFEGFCEECECQTTVAHSDYLGEDVCSDCAVIKFYIEL